MRKQILSFFLLVLAVFSIQAVSKKINLKSPDGRLCIKAELNEKGTVVYEVKKDGSPVILASQMGIKGEVDFTSGLKIVSVSKPKLQTETYSSPAEKRANRIFTANFAKMQLQNSTNNKLTVEFKGLFLFLRCYEK
ncbi:MAG: glycoside hydrolase family 97 N-terminal domain-containing protein [Paludibacter sp.]|nr:glycoside hydrolase family 97 N-terminal domain-containing protein [Paludibacter sp.]